VQPSLRRRRLLPELKKHCRELSDDIISAIARNIGKALVKVNADLESDGEGHLFYETFKGLGERPIEEIRQSCAYNMPAMCKCVGPAKYMLHFHPVLVNLASDSSPHVRATIAAGFHEICKMIGDNRVGHLKESLIQLLGDESSEVHHSLLPQLGSILEVFRSSQESARKANSDLTVSLVAMMDRLNTRWRDQEALVKCWAVTPCCLCGHDVFETIIPAIFQLLQNGEVAMQVTKAATTTLCSLLRRNRYRFHRSSIIKRIGNLLAHGRARERGIFLEFCRVAMAQFSNQLFKQNFLEDCMEIAQDSVANLRVTFLQLACEVRQTLRLPEDDLLVSQLELAIGRGKDDPDRDVRAQWVVANRLLSKLPAQGAGQDQEAKDFRERMLQEEEEDLLGGSEYGEETIADSCDDVNREAAIEAAMRTFLSEQEKEAKKSKAPAMMGRRPMRRLSVPETPQRPDSGRLTARRRALAATDIGSTATGASTTRAAVRRDRRGSGNMARHVIEAPDIPEAIAADPVQKRDLQLPAIRRVGSGTGRSLGSATARQPTPPTVPDAKGRITPRMGRSNRINASSDGPSPPSSRSRQEGVSPRRLAVDTPRCGVGKGATVPEVGASAHSRRTAQAGRRVLPSLSN